MQYLLLRTLKICEEILERKRGNFYILGTVQYAGCTMHIAHAYIVHMYVQLDPGALDKCPSRARGINFKFCDFQGERFDFDA